MLRFGGSIQQGWTPSRQAQHDCRKRHGQQNVLHTFSQLASGFGPKFDVEVICFVGQLQDQQCKPGQGAGNASLEQLRCKHEDQEADQYVQRVHADPRGVFQEQLDLVPAEESHASARFSSITGQREGEPSINRFISAENGIGQRLSLVCSSKPSVASCLLDGVGPGPYNARPAQLREG